MTNAQALPRTCRRRRCCRTTAMGTTTIAGGGSVGSALARMLLDDTTAASASAPDGDCNCEGCAARAEAGPAVASRPCRWHQCRSLPSTSAIVASLAVAAVNIFASCVRSAGETAQDSPPAPVVVGRRRRLRPQPRRRGRVAALALRRRGDTCGGIHQEVRGGELSSAAVGRGGTGTVPREGPPPRPIRAGGGGERRRRPGGGGGIRAARERGPGGRRRHWWMRRSPRIGPQQRWPANTP